MVNTASSDMTSAGVHEIDDPHVGLAGMYPLQATGVLLQRTFQDNGMTSTSVSSDRWHRAPTRDWQRTPRHEHLDRIARH